MTQIILFGREKNTINYTVSGIKSLELSVNNQFFSQTNLSDNFTTLIPSSHQNHVEIECTAIVSEDTLALELAAIDASPIYCKILLSESYHLYGQFYITDLTIEREHLPEVNFTLKSSGQYEYRNE